MITAVLLLFFAVLVSCEDECAFGLYASGLNGVTSLRHSREQAELYVSNDLGPLAAIAQASQQATACMNEAGKGSQKPGKRFPDETERLPLYFNDIVGGHKAEYPNTIVVSTGVDGRVNGRIARITAQATFMFCLLHIGNTCIHRTLLVCENVASSVAGSISNLTAFNLLRAGTSCHPLYQEVQVREHKMWTNVMPYELTQGNLPTKNTSVVFQLPADVASHQLTGIKSHVLSLADSQAAANIKECTETAQLRHQLEANLGLPSVYVSPWNGSVPSVSQIKLQTLVVSCLHATAERQEECKMIMASSRSLLWVSQTGSVCADRHTTAHDFLSTVPILYTAGASSVATTELLPQQVANLDAKGVLAYPPTSLSEIMLASMTCVLALTSSKKGDVVKITRNINNIIIKKPRVVSLTHADSKLQMTIAAFVYFIIAVVSSASAISIAITNVAGARFLSYDTSNEIKDIPFREGAVEVYIMYHVEYHYKPAGYIVSLTVSSIIIIVSMGWAVYRCFTFNKYSPSVLGIKSYP